MPAKRGHSLASQLLRAIHRPTTTNAHIANERAPTRTAPTGPCPETKKPPNKPPPSISRPRPTTTTATETRKSNKRTKEKRRKSATRPTPPHTTNPHTRTAGGEPQQKHHTAHKATNHRTRRKTSWRPKRATQAERTARNKNNGRRAGTPNHHPRHTTKEVSAERGKNPSQRPKNPRPRGAPRTSNRTAAQKHSPAIGKHAPHPARKTRHKGEQRQPAQKGGGRPHIAERKHHNGAHKTRNKRCAERPVEKNTESSEAHQPGRAKPPGENRQHHKADGNTGQHQKSTRTAQIKNTRKQCRNNLEGQGGTPQDTPAHPDNTNTRTSNTEPHQQRTQAQHDQHAYRQARLRPGSHKQPHKANHRGGMQKHTATPDQDNQHHPAHNNPHQERTSKNHKHTNQRQPSNNGPADRQQARLADDHGQAEPARTPPEIAALTDRPTTQPDRHTQGRGTHPSHQRGPLPQDHDHTHNDNTQRENAPLAPNHKATRGQRQADHHNRGTLRDIAGKRINRPKLTREAPSPKHERPEQHDNRTRIANSQPAKQTHQPNHEKTTIENKMQNKTQRRRDPATTPHDGKHKASRNSAPKHPSRKPHHPLRMKDPLLHYGVQTAALPPGDRAPAKNHDPHASKRQQAADTKTKTHETPNTNTTNQEPAKLHKTSNRTPNQRPRSNDHRHCKT